MTTYLTSDYVGVQWLRSLARLVGVDIANEVVDPWVETPTATGTVWKPAWTGRDFISIFAVGGGSDAYSPEFTPVYQVDCWSRPKNKGSQPPWYAANQLAERIRHLQYEIDGTMLVQLPSPYVNARVVDVTALSEPRRVPNDPNGIARYTLDVQVTFIAEGALV